MPWNVREVARAVWSVQIEHAQTGSEAGRFVVPVVQQRLGYHDERRAIEPAGFLFHEHAGQRLDGLPQPHVIGEDATHVVLAQTLHPVQALLLVGA
jgi:hypothetical protein